MEDLHRLLVSIGFAAGPDLGLMLAGGYALAAHDIVDRPSQDIDFATATAMPLPAVAERLAAAYRASGYPAEVLESTPRMARLLVTVADATCQVDLLKEAVGPPAQLRIGPVLPFADAVGLKVRALHDRAAHRDFIDVFAAHSRFDWRDLEALGARHTAQFSLADLADRLGAIGELEGKTFASYGLDEPAVDALVRWASNWESDIRLRLAAGEQGPDGPPESDWDTYLDRG